MQQEHSAELCLSIKEISELAGAFCHRLKLFCKSGEVLISALDHCGIKEAVEVIGIEHRLRYSRGLLIGICHRINGAGLVYKHKVVVADAEGSLEFCLDRVLIRIALSERRFGADTVTVPSGCTRR